LHRPELDACLNHLRKGDVLVVWKLDRLSRSLRDLLWILDRVDKVGAGFRSLTEHNDTTTPAGELMMNMLGSFAHDAERAIMQSHTAAVAV
jgi:DNA invertase Pin-like site-specific DNA recombinase